MPDQAVEEWQPAMSARQRYSTAPESVEGDPQSDRLRIKRRRTYPAQLHAAGW